MLRSRRFYQSEIPSPQLTALIDVMVVFILFLVSGELAGSSGIFVPPEIRLPKSFSQEELVTAPQVTVVADRVRISGVPEEISVESIVRNQVSESIKQQVMNQIDVWKNQRGLSSELPLNLVADSNVAYEVIYAVTMFLRERGVKSVLFVGTTEVGR
jgi:biopolymer transport protein ExbD